MELGISLKSNGSNQGSYRVLVKCGIAECEMRNAVYIAVVLRVDKLCFNTPIEKNTKHENDSYKLFSQFELESIRPNSNCHR